MKPGIGRAAGVPPRWFKRPTRGTPLPADSLRTLTCRDGLFMVTSSSCLCMRASRRLSCSARCLSSARTCSRCSRLLCLAFLELAVPAVVVVDVVVIGAISDVWATGRPATESSRRAPALAGLPGLAHGGCARRGNGRTGRPRCGNDRGGARGGGGWIGLERPHVDAVGDVFDGGQAQQSADIGHGKAEGPALLASMENAPTNLPPGVNSTSSLGWSGRR